MHRVAYRALGIDAEYLRIDCDEDELPAVANLVRRGVLAGANITVPYKTQAFELADGASEEARLLRAANTWVRDHDQLVAHSTDGPGFLKGLGTVPPPRRKKALILGAGGAARAVCLALSRTGWDVTVAARTPEKAAGVFAPLGGTLKRWDEAFFEKVAPSLGLLVNATPVGMTPRENEAPQFPFGNLQAGSVVYDVVYRPGQTLALRTAAALSLVTVGGVRMLVGQGARSFELWFGRPAPEAEMLAAVEGRLL
jgi:shikimate dehydrogenase